MNTSYEAAFSQVDITPDFQIELIGCYREDNRSQGVHQNLFSQILLIRNENKVYSLITIDNIGFTASQGVDLRSRIAKVLDTDISHIMLNFSHTHSGPALESNALNGEHYFNFMCDRILIGVEDAKTKYQSCKAGWALTKTSIGENRREGCTVVDDRLGALKLADASSGKPIVIILRITSHANILMGGYNQISSDLFGAAREKLQSYFSCPVMLVQGPAGNIKPNGVDKIHGGNLSDLTRIADMLLESAKDLVFELNDITDLQMYSMKIKFFADVPSEPEASQIAEEAYHTCFIDGAGWLSECKRLREAGINVQTIEDEVHFLKINNGCFCGVPEEIFCEIALEVKEKANNPFVFFNGYTNGCTGYLAHREEWIKGGFEPLYSYLLFYQFHGHVMPFQVDTSEKLTQFVLDNLAGDLFVSG